MPDTSLVNTVFSTHTFRAHTTSTSASVWSMQSQCDILTTSHVVVTVHYRSATRGVGAGDDHAR